MENLNMKLKPRLAIYKDFTFDSAHSLPCVPEGHKCSNLHGHTWKLSIGITGGIDPERGWIIDFGDVKKLVNTQVIDVLDHAHLNEFIENPTSEYIAQWVWVRLASQILESTQGKAQLYEVIVYETPTSYCSLKAI